MDDRQLPVPTDGSTIWCGNYCGRVGCLKLHLYNADNDEATYTTTQLCQRIRASRDIIEGTKMVEIIFRGDSFDKDVEAVANVLHSLPRFNHLELYVSSAKHETVSVLLRNAPNEKIRALHLCAFRRRSSFSSVSFLLSDLERFAWLSSLQQLKLCHASLVECDCRTLGRVLKQRKRGNEEFRIEIVACIFPSLAGFLVVADALFVSGPFSSRFRLNKVSDETIPSSCGSVIHGDFYSNFYERKEGNRFDDAATDLFTRYSDFYRRLALLRTNKTATFQNWMDALCHDDVRDNVDLLLRLVRTNPGVYFGKDWKRNGVNRMATKKQ